MGARAGIVRARVTISVTTTNFSDRPLSQRIVVMVTSYDNSQDIKTCKLLSRAIRSRYEQVGCVRSYRSCRDVQADRMALESRSSHLLYCHCPTCDIKEFETDKETKVKTVNTKQEVHRTVAKPEEATSKKR